MIPSLDSKQTIARSATYFLTGTFISRFTGMIRDLLMAFYFGASPAVAAFFVAFRLSNLFRRLFGEGALLGGFIPSFEKNREKGAFFIRDTAWTLALVLVLLIAAIESLLAGYLYFGAPSTGGREILLMTMVMMPGLLFISLFGLSAALLQCEKQYFLPGVAPVVFNMIWIAAIYFFHEHPPFEAMLALSSAIVIAFLGQWLLTLPQLLNYLRPRISLFDWQRPKLFSLELKAMMRPLFFGIVGVAAVQINSALDVIMARFASLEGPAYLSYAHRLHQLPLALFGVAIASALLPPLSRAIKESDLARYHSLLEFALRRTFSLLFPTTVAIFVLGYVSVNLIYGHGCFSESATFATTYCLMSYGIGLIPSAFVLLLAPAAYAKGNFRTPTIASLISVALSTSLNILFIFALDLGAISVALSTSCAAYLNLIYLSRKLNLSPFYPAFPRTIAASLLAGLITYALSTLFISSRELTTQLFHFTSLTLTFACLFFTFTHLFKADNPLALFKSKP